MALSGVWHQAYRMCVHACRHRWDSAIEGYKRYDKAWLKSQLQAQLASQRKTV